jgi:DNA-binding transcriptional MerR regulator
MADDAKQAWSAAPEPVQREVERMHRELSQGLEKYRAGAERDHGLREYHELARQGGKDLKSVVDGYWQAEQAIRNNPVQGLDAVCKNLGLSLRDIAAHVMGQPQDQQQAAQSAEVHQLRQTVQQLQQQLGGVTQTIQQQRESVVLDKINSFATQHPRYNELEADMVKLIEAGIAKDLPEAYAKADRLNPAPAKLQVSAETAQTRESKSISGAPTPGSSPASKTRSSSIRESLKRASARAG